MRLDKFLFVSRLFESRSKAAAACNGGRIRLNGRPGRPDSLVVPGDEVALRQQYVTLSFKVLSLPKNRISPRDKVFVLLPLKKEVQASEGLPLSAMRDKGTGRPTKKERRQTDDFMTGFWEDLEG